MIKKGMLIGKFLPFHRGHEALIDFALRHVEQLIIVVAANQTDSIALDVRVDWLKNAYPSNCVTVVPFAHQLPHDGKYSATDTALWCRALAMLCPDIDVFFSSERYGDILADYMGIEHILFSPQRIEVPVSGTVIRQNPHAYADYLSPQVRAYYGIDEE